MRQLFYQNRLLCSLFMVCGFWLINQSSLANSRRGAYRLDCEIDANHKSLYFSNKISAFFRGSYYVSPTIKELRNVEAFVYDPERNEKAAHSHAYENEDKTYSPRLYKNYTRFKFYERDGEYFYLLLPDNKKDIESGLNGEVFYFRAYMPVKLTDQGGDYLPLNCSALTDED